MSADEGAVGYTTSHGLEEQVFTSGKSATPPSPLEGSLQKLQVSGKLSGKIKKVSPKKPKALKRLEPAPGWKPFGSPVKRKLHGKDW